MLYEDLNNYTNVDLEFGVAQSQVLCHDDLCCQINYSITCSTNNLCDKYKLLSYSGFRTLGGGTYTIYIQVRSILLYVKLTEEHCKSKSLLFL